MPPPENNPPVRERERIIMPPPENVCANTHRGRPTTPGGDPTARAEKKRLMPGEYKNWTSIRFFVNYLSNTPSR